MLTGASGRGVLGTAGGACGCVGAGGLGVWAWLPFRVSSLALASGSARLWMAAAARCLHQPPSALGKSRHSQVPLHTAYAVVPLDWLATLALPSANSSTSPARTIATAFSMRPLTASGNAALARSATSATASRQACRAGLSGTGLPSNMSSQEISVTIAIAQFLSGGVGVKAGSWLVQGFNSSPLV